MNRLSCAFAGQDPLRFPFGYDEDDELCIRIKSAMLMQIITLCENGVTDFYTDCEAGASMWGAELLLGLMGQYPKLKLCCIIPFEDQAKKWTPQLRDRYYTILEKSTHNHLISFQHTGDCRLHCNQYLVDHTGFLIAVYDDTITYLEPAAQLIAYARKKKRGIITIHPDTAAITPITIKVEL